MRAGYEFGPEVAAGRTVEPLDSNLTEWAFVTVASAEGV